MTPTAGAGLLICAGCTSIAVMWRNLLLCAVGAAALTGCGSAAPQYAPATRAAAPAQREPTQAYIDAVQQLLQPPGEMASLVVARIGGDTRGLNPRTAHEAVERTGERIASLKALRLRSPVLRAQRARIVAAIAGPVVTTMNRIAAATDRGETAAIEREGRRLIELVKELPSRVAA